MQVQPYLFFNGRCEEAIRYYQQQLGAKLNMLMRYRDAPDECKDVKADSEKIMYCNLSIGETVLMASDDCMDMHAAFQGFSLSLSVSDDDEAKRVFTALSDGGKVRMPLGKTFFSSCFGVVVDRFDVSWMIIVPQP